MRRKQFIAALAAAACVLIAIGISLNVATRLHSKEAVPGKVASTIPPRNEPVQANGDTVKPAVVLLVAERIRGDQQIKTYQVPRDVPIELQLLLVGETGPRSGYTLRVESITGKQRILLQRENLNAQLTEGQLYIKATFPAGSLPPETYRASLRNGEQTLAAHFIIKN